MDSDFEKLKVWKKSCRFVISVYQLFRNFPDSGLYSQMTRAAVSIPSNIAEGCERNSKRDFVHFLYIAKGSAAELRTQLYLASELGFISKEDALSMANECKAISKMLKGLINSFTSDK